MFPNETINPRIMCHFCPQKTISHSGLNRAKFWEMSKNQFTTADSEYSVFFPFSFSQCRKRKKTSEKHVISFLNTVYVEVKQPLWVCTPAALNKKKKKNK